MKIYHVKTQEDYDALMVELEERGAKWILGQKATDINEWHGYKECTCIFLENNIIEYGNIDFFKEEYPDITIQEYKAKDNFVTDDSFSLDNTIKQATNDAEMYRKIIDNLEQTYLAKNKDYGNSFEESLDEFGEIAGIVRIGDKFNRIKSLSKTEEVNVKDESKIDTLLDMANYCIMQAMWLMKQED